MIAQDASPEYLRITIIKHYGKYACILYIYFNCLYLAQMAISGQWYGTHLFQDLIVALKMYLYDVFIKEKEQPEAMV